MSGDQNMLRAYQEGKDQYSSIASMSFGFPYEECQEFYPEGKVITIDGKKVTCGYKTHRNNEGADRRSAAKSILLGLEYGRGAASIGEQIGRSREEAQRIIDNFFRSYPSVKNWIDATHESVKKIGYVEDWHGRRRRLPNIFLPEYEFSRANGDNDTFNPLLECGDRVDCDFGKKTKALLAKLKASRSASQRDAIIASALNDGIVVKSNGGKIAEAERQSVNAIIQGGAATLTKLAMINIANDPELNAMGFRLLSTIHDEVLGEVPIGYAEEAKDRLCQVMVDTSKPYMVVPMKCDGYCVSHWYEFEYREVLRGEYEGYERSGMDKDEALSELRKNHPEADDAMIRSIIEV